jgi:hypothetical protein
VSLFVILQGKQNKAELRKLIYGESDYCPHLEIMFKNMAVDGNTSYIPGEEDEEEEEKKEEEKEEND